MQGDKVINFGYFVRWKRIEKGFGKQKKFADAVGLSARRVGDIEKSMPTPDLPDSTVGAIAAALGMPIERLLSEWKETPVSVPSFKAGPEMKGQGEEAVKESPQAQALTAFVQKRKPDREAVLQRMDRDVVESLAEITADFLDGAIEAVKPGQGKRPRKAAKSKQK